MAKSKISEGTSISQGLFSSDQVKQGEKEGRKVELSTEVNREAIRLEMVLPAYLRHAYVFFQSFLEGYWGAAPSLRGLEKFQDINLRGRHPFLECLVLRLAAMISSMPYCIQVTIDFHVIYLFDFFPSFPPP